MLFYLKMSSGIVFMKFVVSVVFKNLFGAVIDDVIKIKPIIFLSTC